MAEGGSSSWLDPQRDPHLLTCQGGTKEDLAARSRWLKEVVPPGPMGQVPATHQRDPLEREELVLLRVDGLLQVAVAVDQLLRLREALAVLAVAHQRHPGSNTDD